MIRLFIGMCTIGYDYILSLTDRFHLFCKKEDIKMSSNINNQYSVESFSECSKCGKIKIAVKKR